MKALKFYKSNCQPCVILSNTLKANGIVLEEVNTDDPTTHPMVRKYGLRTVPAIVIVDPDGNRMETITGQMSPEQLTRLKELSL